MLPFEKVKGHGSSPTKDESSGLASPGKVPATGGMVAFDMTSGASPTKKNGAAVGGGTFGRTEQGGVPGVFRPHSRPVGVAGKDQRYARTPQQYSSLGDSRPQPGKARSDMKPRSVMLPGQGNTVGVVHVSAKATGSPSHPGAGRSPSPKRGGGIGGGDRSGLVAVKSPGRTGRLDPNSTTGISSSVLAITASPSALSSQQHQQQLQSLVSAEDNEDGLTLEELTDPQTTSVDYKKFDLDKDLPRNDHRTKKAPVCRINLDPAIVVASPGSYFSSEGVGSPSFASQVITVEEIGIERALEYLIYCETPSIFAVPPSVDPQTGTLTFATLPDVSGLSVCWLRLTDNAMINTSHFFKEGEGPALGEPYCSELVPFVIAVGVEQAAANASLLASRTNAAGKAPRDWHSHAARAKAETVALVHESTDAVPTTTKGEPEEFSELYRFPPTSPHSLRSEGVCFELYNKYCKQIATLSTSDVALTGGNPSAFIDSANPAYSLLCQLTAPVIGSSIPVIDLLRMTNFCAVKDSLFGEIAEASQIQALEAKLLERIRKEERRLGANHLDLVPLLLRLGQLYVQYGARRQGDAIEVLERVARIRMHFIGLQSHGSIEPGSVDLQTAGGEEALQRYEQYYQSLMTVAQYLRYIGQYQDAIEFCEYAANVAEALGGQTSSTYLNAISLIGEVLLVSGDLKQAKKSLERNLDLTEATFGPEAPQTNTACHILAVCNTANGYYAEAERLHRRALHSRQAARDTPNGNTPEANLLVAESLVFITSSHTTRPDGNMNVEDALGTAEAALDLYETCGVYNTPETTIAHSALLLTIATAYATKGDGSALHLAERARTDISTLRGEDSVEAAIFSVELAACHMRLGLSSFAENQLQSKDLKKSGGLNLLESLTAQLSSQHPITARAWLMLGQCLMYKNRAESKSFMEHASVNLNKRLSPGHRDCGLAAELLCRVHLELSEITAAEAAIQTAYSVALNTEHTARLESLETLLCAVFSEKRVSLPSDILSSIERRVRETKERYGPTALQLISPLQNLAEGYYLRGDFSDSHHHFTRALKLADSLNMVFLLGHLFKPSAQLSPAEVEERNRMAQDRLNPLTASHFARILLGIGASFEAEGSLGDCQQTYLQAQAALEIAGSTTSMATVELLMSVARVLFRDGHFGDCLAYLEKAHNLLLEYHSKEARLISQAEESLRIVHRRLTANGYRLVRHTDNRHKFAAYI